MTASTATVPAMHRRSWSVRAAALPAGLAAAAALATSGALQLTNLHWGTQMLVRTLPQHLTMALFVAGMIATFPLLLTIGREAGGVARVAAGVAIAGQLLISVITTQSNITGHDAKAFNTLAGLGMLLWMSALIVLAITAARRRVLPKLTAFALVLTCPAAVLLATRGVGLLAAACWLGIAVTSGRQR
jgi:hypothetical protein